MGKIVIAFIAALAVLLPTAPAAEAAHSHYGESARKVAGEIGCKRFHRNGSGAFHRDSGVCWVRGKRVNVITFRNALQQRDWNAVARAGLSARHWWANGRGAVVTARNGNKPAARIGARRLPGVLRHG